MALHVHTIHKLYFYFGVRFKLANCWDYLRKNSEQITWDSSHSQITRNLFGQFFFRKNHKQLFLTLPLSDVRPGANANCTLKIIQCLIWPTSFATCSVTYTCHRIPIWNRYCDGIGSSKVDLSTSGWLNCCLCSSYANMNRLTS